MLVSRRWPVEQAILVQHLKSTAGPAKRPVNEALGILEVTGLTPAMVALDTMDKTSGVRVLQIESNDFYGVVLKVTGSQADVAAAIAAGKAIAESMGGKPVATVLNRPDERAWPALESKV